VSAPDVLLTLPARLYTDPVQYSVEQREVFGKEWVLVGYEFELLESGDYITEDVAGQLVVVWRSPEGSLVSFLNVCPHRAGPIMWEGPGCQANLVCRYHGWAFQPDGALRATPGFGGKVPEGVGLQMVRVDTWRGMVFVCLHPDTEPLAQYLGEFPSVCEQYPIENYRFHSRTVRTMAVNWKTYSDNFLEGYHVPYIHPGMSRDVSAKDYVVITNPDRRWNVHVAKPRNDESLWDGIWVYFYPNFSMDIFPGGLSVERWLPRGPGQTDLIFEYFFDENAPNVDEIIKTSEEVADEDVRAAEHVQRAFQSGAYSQGFLSPRHENAVAMFHDTIRDVISVGGPAGPVLRVDHNDVG
jgi:choline monooxygenase